MPSRGQRVTTTSVTTDVVIVGFGAAGTSAAITAREHGAEVIAVDRANGGGATAISGGIIYAGGGTSVQQAAGVDDSAEQMLDYLRLEVGDAVSPETLQRFVDTSPEMIDWLQRHGVPFNPGLCPYKTSFPNNRYYLYHSGSENAGVSRAVTPPVQRGHRAYGKGTSGKQIYAPLAESARRLGVDFRPHTTVTELTQDPSGRVTGVRAMTMGQTPRRIQRRYARLAAISSKPGVYYPPLRAAMDRRLKKLEQRYARPIEITARRGVVICAGGFIANTEWRKRYAPEFNGGLPLGTSGDDGSGIALAASVGGVPDRMDNVSAWRFITPPSAFISSIVVDEKGSRVIDETRYGAALGQALVKNHGSKGWILADATLMAEARRQLLTQTLWFQRAQAAALILTGAARGKTLADAARAAGIDPEGLRATVAAHNDAIDSATEDPAGKPTEFRRRIDRAPFTLLDISVRPNVLLPTPMLTLGGVRVAEDTGAVIDADGTPIPGLYSAGRTAIGVASRSYVSGLSIADCVFAGRRAGASAAGATV
ncbi:FAD-binding protein [Mycolicibacter sinensis]